MLKKAYDNFDLSNKDFVKFCKANKYWLDDFALYMALKNSFEGKPWNKWDISLKTRNSKAIEQAFAENKYEISFQKFIQYLFFKQWSNLKKYANENGVFIIGDIPIYDNQ